MRTYRNGELVGYGDEVAVVTKSEYEIGDFSNAYYYDTVAEAVEEIENNELGLGDENLCVVKVKEYYDGTDYELEAEYYYDDENEKYQLAHNIM